MAQFEIVQAGFIMPILYGLKDSGANVDRLLKPSGLNKFSLDDVNNYVPMHSMYSFFDELERQGGITDVSDQFSEHIELAGVSQWIEMIVNMPDFLTAIQFAKKSSGVLLSHEKIGLEINGNKAKYWQCFSGRDCNGLKQTDFMSFAIAIKAYYLAAGSDCAPLEIHLQSNIAPNWDILLPSGNNTKILLGQATSGFVFPTSFLAKPMLGYNVSGEVVPDFSSVSTYSNKIENLLCSMKPDYPLNMSLIAEMTESSSRSLQRRLAQEGTSISGVIDQWRFKQAVQLLEQPKIRVKDIYQQLGYANGPNFVRAFSRWTGVSPNRYREQL